MMESKPSINRLEKAIVDKNYEVACSELLNILEKIDGNFGGINEIEFDFPEQISDLLEKRTQYFCTRLANAVTNLFIDPNLILSESGALRFIAFQRWLALIFASSPYVNADHILKTYNTNSDILGDIHLNNDFSAIAKFCILYFPESNININLDVLWEINKELCASLCFALQSSRFLGTATAFNKRAAILQWFPNKLEEFDSLNQLPASISHDVYMHCSYDFAQNKHDVKRALNQVIRKHLLAQGWLVKLLH